MTSQTGGMTMTSQAGGMPMTSQAGGMPMTSQAGGFPMTSQAGGMSSMSAQPVSMSQPVVMSQIIGSQVNTSPIVSMANTPSEAVVTSSTGMRSQRSVPSNLQSFEGFGNTAGQVDAHNTLFNVLKLRSLLLNFLVRCGFRNSSQKQTSKQKGVCMYPKVYSIIE